MYYPPYSLYMERGAWFMHPALFYYLERLAMAATPPAAKSCFSLRTSANVRVPVQAGLGEPLSKLLQWSALLLAGLLGVVTAVAGQSGAVIGITTAMALAVGAILLFVVRSWNAGSSRTELDIDGRWGSFRAGILIALVAVAAFKQIAVNAVGGDRQLVAAAVEAVAACAAIVCPVVVVLRTKSGPFRRQMLATMLLQAALLLWWGALVLVGPGGDLGQRLVAYGYDAWFTLLVWVPLSLLNHGRSVPVAESGLGLVLGVVASIGVLQWLVPDALLPGLLRSDNTVALSGTIFGTTRVNGLIGTSIDFGMIMCLSLTIFYSRLQDRLSVRAMCLTFLGVVGILFSGSRAALLTGVLVLLLLTSFRKVLWLLVPLLAVGLLVLILPSGYVTAPLSGAAAYQRSDALRVASIETAVEDIESSPIIGTGIGFQTGPSFDQSVPGKVLTDGFWWSVALEGGLVGLALLFSFYAAIGMLLLRWARGRYRRRVWAMACLVLMAVVLLQGFINSSLVNQSTNMMFYLLVGFCLTAALGPTSSLSANRLALEPLEPGRTSRTEATVAV